MESEDTYENIEDLVLSQRRRDSGSEEMVKAAHSVQPGNPVPGKFSPHVISILLGLSILLSVTALGAAITLRTRTPNARLWMEFFQWKNKVTQIVNETKTAATGFWIQLSQWKDNVTGNFEEVRSSIAKLQVQISRLREDVDSCPKQWTRFKQSCYQISSRISNWDEARRSCAAASAHLVVINNAEEQNFIRNQIQTLDHWIGLSDSASEGDWRWVDGTAYSSSVTYWAGGEPNNRYNEDCVKVLKDGKWNDIPCTVGQQWICEKPVL